MLMMSDGDVESRIVRDISGGAGTPWRWTGQHPTVRLPGGAATDLKYVIDFTIADATFKETGPVTVAFYVNDHVLDRVRYAASGPQHFEKDVPRDWIVEGEETKIGAEIDKTYLAKDDNQRLGFILTSIGLKQE
jgi:hypothetical protein